MAVMNSCKSQDLETARFVDPKKYSGKWYEIAHLPASFLEGCSCTTAEYTYTTKGYIKVYNRCYNSRKGKWKSITGKAFVVNNSRNSKLKVQFFWPFKANYWIIELADDYSWAVVGEPRRRYLWILSRTPEMDEALYQELVVKCGNKGFPVEHLEITKQDSCE